MTLNVAVRGFVALLLIGVFATAAGAAEAVDLHSRVVATYGFRPRDLNDAQLEAKSVELDAFWQLVRARGSAGLPQLRAELTRADSPAFFRYDGAKLLLSMSTSAEDRNLALRSIARTELRDIQRDDYFSTVHELAVAGLDTTAAALNVLSDPEFIVTVPLHAMTLGQDRCFLYMLLPTEEAFYLKPVIARLNVEEDPVAIKTILVFLSYVVARDADDAIRAFAADKRRPAPLRDFAASLVRALEEARSSPLGISRGSYDSLKAARRRTMARVSDEAIYEADRQTLRIRRKQPPARRRPPGRPPLTTKIN